MNKSTYRFRVLKRLRIKENVICVELFWMFCHFFPPYYLTVLTGGVCHQITSFSSDCGWWVFPFKTGESTTFVNGHSLQNLEKTEMVPVNFWMQIKFEFYWFCTETLFFPTWLAHNGRFRDKLQGCAHADTSNGLFLYMACCTHSCCRVVASPFLATIFFFSLLKFRGSKRERSIAIRDVPFELAPLWSFLCNFFFNYEAFKFIGTTYFEAQNLTQWSNTR